MTTYRIARAAGVAALIACAVAAAQTNVYRWVDKDGKVHFSDSPPPTDAKESSQKRMGGGGDDSGLPYATQVAMKRNPVLLYSSNDCGDPCSQGRDLLARRGIPFGERNAQTNPADTEALKKLIGTLEVPVLTVGTNKVKGYSESLWHQALDSAGYPRTRLPGPADAKPAQAVTPAPNSAAPVPANAAVPAADPGQAGSKAQ